MHDTIKIGKGMMIVAWGILLAFLAFIFSEWEKDKYNPNRDIEYAQSNKAKRVMLKRNNHGHYMASGKVNGKHVVFMLDTGATDVAIPSSLAKELALQQGQEHKVITANGVARAYRTTLNSVTLGNIQLRDVRASISPGMVGDEILLGMSALKQLDFSQSGDTLTLTQYK